MGSNSPSEQPAEWRFPALQVQLPDWVAHVLPAPGHVYATLEERMDLAINLAHRNVEHGGGPFGAAIFDSAAGTLLAPGVNTVVSSSWCGAHAEMVAIAIAQQVARHHDLAAFGAGRYELVTSCEPCSMCFGATPWTGVTKLVCGAREEDALKIGFDEGPKPQDWTRTLETRGIRVVRDVRRDQAQAVLRQYAEQGGVIYNARRDA